MRCSEDAQKCSVQNMIFISVFNQLDAQNLFDNKLYRCGDTRGCVMNFDLLMTSTCARNM